MQGAGGRDDGLRNGILQVILRCQRLEQAQRRPDEQKLYYLPHNQSRLFLNGHLILTSWQVFWLSPVRLTFPGLATSNSGQTDESLRPVAFWRRTPERDHSCRHSPGLAPGSLAPTLQKVADGYQNRREGSIFFRLFLFLRLILCRNETAFRNTSIVGSASRRSIMQPDS